MKNINTSDPFQNVSLLMALFPKSFWNSPHYLSLYTNHTINCNVQEMELLHLQKPEVIFYVKDKALEKYTRCCDIPIKIRIIQITGFPWNTQWKWKLGFEEAGQKEYFWIIILLKEYHGKPNKEMGYTTKQSTDLT